VLAWGHPRVGGDATCGFFVVSSATLAGWMHLGGGAVVPSTSPFMSVHHIFQTTTWGRPPITPSTIGKDGRKAWDGAVLFCIVKRFATNKPRDPGCHNRMYKTQPNDPGHRTDMDRLRADHACRSWTLFEDENKSLIGMELSIVRCFGRSASHFSLAGRLRNANAIFYWSFPPQNIACDL
jgi:hypothetical protein